MERLINERLIWWLERNNKLDPMQIGFRRGKSCMENLTKMIADITSVSLDGEYTSVAFLDVTSAYDVNFNIMTKKLREEGCPSEIYNFICNWLQPRDTTFIVNNQTVEHRRVFRGLPQGAVLSPILYALYTNKITRERTTRFGLYSSRIMLQSMYRVETDSKTKIILKGRFTLLREIWQF